MFVRQICRIGHLDANPESQSPRTSGSTPDMALLNNSKSFQREENNAGQNFLP